MLQGPKRSRGRPRKYPLLPNKGRTFNCVPSAIYLVLPPAGVPPGDIAVAKLLYHRSFIMPNEK